MSETFILVPGRTSKQGVGISEGKYEDNYQYEIHHLQVPPEDMERLGLKKGDWVQLKCEHGAIEVEIIPSKGDELPPGMLLLLTVICPASLWVAILMGRGCPRVKVLM